MTKSQFSPSIELLKKLRGKAELCRYCHANLQAKYEALQRVKEFSIVLLSLLSTALVGLYYRGILGAEPVFLFIFFLSLFVALFQSLDQTVFCWTDRANKHESAVQIWGAWIRDADFLEKKFPQYAKNVANEKLENMQEKYGDCMSRTPQIPNKKFLKYKMDFKAYVLKSKAIDSMTSGYIANEKSWCRKKSKK